MPRKKKRPYSTKKWIEPKTEAATEEEKTEEVAEEAPADPAVPTPEPGKFTLDQAIEQFKKNPKEETFWIPPEYPQGQAIAAGDIYIKFEKGIFRTSNPAEVETIMRSVGPGITYNMHIFAMSPGLRNLKK